MSRVADIYLFSNTDLIAGKQIFRDDFSQGRLQTLKSRTKAGSIVTDQQRLQSPRVLLCLPDPILKPDNSPSKSQIEA